MKNFRIRIAETLVILAILTSCSNNNSSPYSSSGNSTSAVEEKDPYEIMHIAFEGYPEIVEIKPLLEAVMETYSFPKTDENRLKVGNMLVALRKASTVGVTEMEILKHIYQHGSNKISLPDQAGLSATLLEVDK